MNMMHGKILILSVVLWILVLTIPVQAMLNPSAVYCEKLGYSYETLKDPQGEYGVCHLPGNQTVRAWEFLRGRAGQQYSYCARMGYPSKNVSDLKTCAAVSDNSCSVCVLPDNREVEVTTLMNLSFAETICGDGSCGLGENALTCPRDCPPSGRDGLCQRTFDLRCDPDCAFERQGDVDCMYLGNPIITLIVVVAIVLAVLGICFWIRKKNVKK
jgi:putative hemolysin